MQECGLNVIVAAPGQGKTEELVRVVAHSDQPALFITLEQEARTVKARLAGRFETDRLLWGRTRAEGDVTIADASQLETYDLNKLDDTLTKWTAKQPGSIVALDWFDMLGRGLSGASATEKAQFVKDTAAGLAQLARKHNVMLWTATQGGSALDSELAYVRPLMANADYVMALERKVLKSRTADTEQA